MAKESYVAQQTIGLISIGTYLYSSANNHLPTWYQIYEFMMDALLHAVNGID